MLPYLDARVFVRTRPVYVLGFGIIVLPPEVIQLGPLCVVVAVCSRSFVFGSLSPLEFPEIDSSAVSYTHLTLPTIYSV